MGENRFRWSKYLSRFIVTHPLGQFCGTKSLLRCKRIKIFLVAPPKKVFQHHLKHITFSLALNTRQKSYKVLQGGATIKTFMRSHGAMLHSMNTINL